MLVEWPDANRPPAQIEVAFDRGAIRADGRETPICEIELELKRGEPRALFELAQSMRALAPVRLQPLDKAARGYGLVTGAPPAWRKAAPMQLEETMTVEDALQTILGGCVRHWMENEAATRDARDPEGLHQLRVALRRLRSALAPVQDGPGRRRREPTGTRAALASRARWARRATSTCSRPRRSCPGARGAAPDDPALAAAGRARRRRPLEGPPEVRETLASERYGDIAFGLACWVACRGWRQGADIDVLLAQRRTVRDFAAEILTRRHRQVRKRGRNFAGLGPESPATSCGSQFKKLRYGTEFFASLFPGREFDRYRRPRPRGCRTCSAT